MITFNSRTRRRRRRFTETVAFDVLVVAFAFGVVTLGFRLVISGALGVQDDGGSAWEFFKILLGVALIFGRKD